MQSKVEDLTQVAVADFGNIAISFSGGGYRAATFHLGSLDLLHRLDLLEKVTMLSTVSGGTITGAKYVLSLSRKDPEADRETFFKKFYDELYQFLFQERLPDIWLQNMSNQRQAQRQSSLIVAAAETYNRLFQEARFKEVIEAKPKLHLKEIVFNTTELRTGTNFRFRVGTGGLIGNGNVSIPKAVLEEVRIADVVAASSCFPVGFEPIDFPHDFEWSNGWESVMNKLSPEKRDYLTKKLKDPLPLIDGGVYDNLGIEALWLADQRVRNQHFIDTLIISDTDNIGIEETLLEKPQPQLMLPKWLMKMTLKQVVHIVRVLFLLFLASTAICIVYLVGWAKNISLANVLILWATIIFALLALIFQKLSRLFKRLSSQPLVLEKEQLKSSSTRKSISRFLQNIISDWDGFLKTVGDLTIIEAYNLSIIRFQSIPATFLAFLKGQRRRNYNRAFEEYKLKVIDNFIFETQRKLEQEFPKVAEVALKATQSPTTLWFDANPRQAREQLNNLIACGQFTMCYKILEHINKLSKQDNTVISPQMQEVHQKALDIWEQLKENPHALIRE